jgi:hypothetical protein
MHSARSRNRRGTVAAALVGLAVPGVARADAEAVAPGTGAEPLRRELAGHLFLPSRFSPDPFVSTYVASETGVGEGTSKGHTFDINGNPVATAEYDVAAFAQYLDFQYGFLDWWAVRASVRVVVYSGTNNAGIVAVGASIQANPSLGTTVSFKIGDRLRLGGSLDVAFGPAVFFNILEAVKASQGSNEITAPVNSFSQFTLKPAVVGAWAISEAFGLTYSLNYQYTHASATYAAIHANLLELSALVDFDMYSLRWAPIGLYAGFLTNFSVTDTKFLRYQYQFGIFYTGVRPLEVGLEILYLRSPIIGNTDIFVSSVSALIAIQYNFN